MTKQLAAAAVTSGLLALTLAAAKYDAHRPPDRLTSPLESIPAQIGDWKLAHSEVLPEDVLRLLKATTYVSRSYRRGDLQADFFAAFYDSQAAGEDLHTPQNCLPGNGWEILSSVPKQLHWAGRLVPIKEYTIRSGNSRAVALYWYQTRDRVIANEYVGKMFLFWDALTRGRKSAFAVRVVVPDVPGATAAGEEFATAILPEVQRTVR